MAVRLPWVWPLLLNAVLTSAQYSFQLLHNTSGYSSPASSSIEVIRSFSSSGAGVSGLGYDSPYVKVPQHIPIAPRRLNPVYQQPGHNFLTATGYGSAELYPLAAGPRPECVQGPAVCQNAKYRSLDGSCNNLKRPQWGMSGTRYGRLVAAKYADGLHAPPVSVTGHALPSARLVSVILFPDIDIKDHRWTLITMQWGQIVTHDMSMAMGNSQANDTYEEGEGDALNETQPTVEPYATSCCSNDGRVALGADQASPVCYPILIPRDDPVFGPYRQGCMNFVRSTTDTKQGCGSGVEPAEQLTTVTSYMDLSLVYGPNQEVSDSLREFRGGRLLVEVRNGKEYPPTNVNRTDVCDGESEGEPCYQTGDVRANQNPQLTVLQVMLLREHNRLVGVLSQLNPHWDDETLFQEARRINIAQCQHLTYYEWLPLFLGSDNLRRHGIIYKSSSHINDYREEVDPSTLQGHATAAFRYFHSLIAGHLHMVSEDRHSYGAVRLSDVFNRPAILEQGDGLDDLSRGMVTQPEQASDPFFTSEITDFLFRMGRPFGLDLRAIDIQRGRDHGLGSYNDYRNLCGLKRAASFQDFSDHISAENIEKLSSLYEHPDDVDFTVGGSLERHVPGTEAGPTFNCLLMEQFYRTRVGDRYFYESAISPYPFTTEQLSEIRKHTIARLICDNGDSIETMQPQAFNFPAHDNPLLPCSQIPAPDLSAWQEPRVSPEYYFGKK